MALTTHGKRLNEPDNEDKFPAAIHAKHRLGRYPVLAPGDVAPEYRRLWEWILTGGYEGRREAWARKILGPGERERIFDGKRDLATTAAAALVRNPSVRHLPADRPPDTQVVAKSIHSQLSLEWIASTFDVQVLVLLRHPANVLASWMAVNLKDSRNRTLETRPEIQASYADRWGVPRPGSDPIELMSWRIGLLIAALEEAMARNPHWVVRTHEQLCDGPIAQFQHLFNELSIPWNDDVELFLTESDRPGEGFQTNRVASELSGAWQHRLDADQVATLRRTLAHFPITRWSDADFEIDS